MLALLACALARKNGFQAIRVGKPDLLRQGVSRHPLSLYELERSGQKLLVREIRIRDKGAIEGWYFRSSLLVREHGSDAGHARQLACLPVVEIPQERVLPTPLGVHVAAQVLLYLVDRKTMKID